MLKSNTMLGHIYYFFGLIIFLSNLTLTMNILRLLKIKEWSVKFHKVSGRHPIKSDFRDNQYEQFVMANSVWVLTFFWIFFGLVTKSWLLFLILLILNFLVTFISKSLGQFNFLSKMLEVFRIIINTSIIGFLIINHFHLHMNIIELIM